MKLSDIFDQLKTGEFSQISIGGQDRGVVNEENYPEILKHVNLGLTRLFTRFQLKEREVRVRLQEGKSQYPLKMQYAVANKRSREGVRYILDSELDVFNEDIIKIKRVLTDKRVELPLNNHADMFSCFTPGLSNLIVPPELTNNASYTPEEYKTTDVLVVYQANHAQLSIPIGLFDPNRVDIELPYSHLEALCYFIASRVNNPIGMNNEFHAGNSYAAKFEQICRELEGNGIQIEQGTGTNRRERNGWA